jgi:putative ABC transport system permease protein
LILAFRLARRELRGGLRGMRIVLACLALGVAVIAAVGTLRASIDQGLALNGRALLGGDIEVESGSQPLPDALRSWLRGRGARISDVLETRSMLIAPSGERQLVALKAVDENWPLVGDPVFAPAADVKTALSGVVADQVVLDRLGVKPGDEMRLGTAKLPLRGALVFEPDRVTGGALAPAAIIALSALPDTGLVQPGSLVEHALRVALPDGANRRATVAALRAAFPDQGWRIRDAGRAAPGVSSFVDQTGLFLTLVGLTSLLVGGIGVANGVRAWLEARARSIAILRCLGASARLVFAVSLIQVAALSLAGIAAGLVAGAALVLGGLKLFGDLLPAPAHVALYPGPLALAAAYGLLAAAAFSLWPLGRASRIPGAALFRDAVLPETGRPGAWIVGGTIGLAAALVLLTVASGPDPLLALYFCGGAVASMALFRAGAWALVRTARALPRPRAPWARLGVANLHRPGAAAPLMLVSVGLGLATLAAVGMIQGNLHAQIAERMPADAPSFFFIDIQNDQLARFEQVVRADEQASDLREVPSLRARIVAIKGVPVEDAKVSEDTRWATRGDRGMTYAATPPEGTRIVEGAWWPPDYDGEPLLSFDAGLAKGWGLGVGDVLRVNVLGRDVDLKVASLREVAWRSLSLNFTLVVSPGLLSRAPHSHIATVRVPDADQGALLRAVTDALPNVTGIPVADVLRAVAGVLDKVAFALSGMGALALASGALVLAGAVASGQRRRIAEAVVLKSLGATRAQLRAAWMVEFGALGLAAGLIAALVGTAASYAVMTWVMHADWVFLPGRLAATLLACVALMLGFGWIGAAAALRAKAAPLLRTE